MLQFARSTFFREVEEDIPEIPQHKFNFVEYDQLSSRVDINDILSDVIGRLISIKGVEESNVGNRVVKRRNLTIQNIREESLSITLWGEIGENFDENAVQQMSEPVIIAFTAMATKQYLGGLYVASTSATSFYFEPTIAESEKIKRRFSHSIQGIDFITPSTEKPVTLEEQKTMNRLMIAELRCLDPYQNQDQKFTTKATITQIDAQQGWFYNACPRCYRRVRQSGTSWWCDTHAYLTTIPITWYKINARIEDSTGGINIVMLGKTVQSLVNKACSILTIQEGYTDPNTIPPLIDQLKGMSKIFLIQFRPRGAFIDATVVKTFDDDESQMLLPAPPVQSPKHIPQPLTSLDPQTPLPETKKGVKKQLFITESTTEELQSSPQQHPSSTEIQTYFADPSRKRKESRSDEKGKKIRHG
ncbi:hypothetical protein TIFTF001_052794 [Ficus carica]|uniref:Replication factor A C-terminal domain-containing protein n=1 Tax=Ficus carica TaxID=3494 RepID=A0AA88JFK8_FICCA|nr:hypothetical protein TIFTF001_052794 [Ficus carica]